MKTIEDLKPQIKKALPELQALVNELKRLPAFSEYLNNHKLHLIDSQYQIIDDLLEHGILKI